MQMIAVVCVGSAKAGDLVLCLVVDIIDESYAKSDFRIVRTRIAMP